MLWVADNKGPQRRHDGTDLRLGVLGSTCMLDTRDWSHALEDPVPAVDVKLYCVTQACYFNEVLMKDASAPSVQLPVNLYWFPNTKCLFNDR